MSGCKEPYERRLEDEQMSDPGEATLNIDGDWRWPTWLFCVVCNKRTEHEPWITRDNLPDIQCLICRTIYPM